MDKCLKCKEKQLGCVCEDFPVFFEMSNSSSEMSSSPTNSLDKVFFESHKKQKLQTFVAIQMKDESSSESFGVSQEYTIPSCNRCGRVGHKS